MNIIKEIDDLCKGAIFIKCSYRTVLSPQKIAVVMENYNIPDSEVIIYLYDDTQFETGKSGVAICSNGIHIKNGDATYIPWEKFARAPIKFKTSGFMTLPKFEIDGNDIHVEEEMPLKEFVQIFIDIQNILNGKEYAAEENLNKKSSRAGRIDELCKNLLIEKKYHYKDSIDKSFLEEAREIYSIHDSDVIIALYDTAMLRYGKNGFIISSSGIYFKVINGEPKYISWDDFTKTLMVQCGGTILIGDYSFYPNPGCFPAILQLLKNINEILLELEDVNYTKYTDRLSGANKTIKAVEKLDSLCENFVIKGYYYKTTIPENKIINVKNYYSIPDSEKIIALYDASIFGSGKTGVVICEIGIYVRNLLNDAVYISWTDMVKYKIELKDDGHIFIGGFCIEALKASQLIELLKQIQNIFLKAQAENIEHIEEEMKRGIDDAKVSSDKNQAESKDEWRIAINGKLYGIFDKETLKSKINSKELKSEECYVWKQGMSEWMPFLQIQELKDLINESFSEAPPLPKEINNMSSKGEVETEKIDINNCSLDDLFTLDCMNLKNSKLILDKRKDGVIFNSPEEVQKLLGLKPHQVEEIREKVGFNNDFNLKQNNKNNKESHSRLIDY